jgi:hypothetical protein
MTSMSFDPQYWQPSRAGGIESLGRRLRQAIVGGQLAILAVDFQQQLHRTGRVIGQAPAAGPVAQSHE